MVKNKKGGKKGKKGARKFLKDVSKPKSRYSEQDAEMYALVTKTYGHGMVEVMCNDGVSRICIIRKKFSGRNRRDNNIGLNTFVLVGLREWEVTKKKPKCDLIYVYSQNQIPELKKKVVFHKKLVGSITSMGVNIDETEEDIGFDMNGGDDTEFQINEEEDENIKLDGQEENNTSFYETVMNTDKSTKNNDGGKDDTWEDEWEDI
tara:strand:- start:156 stop:770 length:615 start_codon:yes stop_codon:yes gene_type:complete